MAFILVSLYVGSCWTIADVVVTSAQEQRYVGTDSAEDRLEISYLSCSDAGVTGKGDVSKRMYRR